MRLNRFFLVFIFNIFVCCMQSQSQLSIEQAIDIGLKNNYDLSIVRNNSAISANNSTPGNAGMLPKVDLQASVGLSDNATKQEFSSGLKVDKAGVQSNNIIAGVYMTWTLFDGFKMFASYQRLKELEAMGMLSSKIQIENTLSLIIVGYYNIVRQKQLITGLSENIKISEERLKIAQTKMNIGSGSKLDVLQAKVDMNAQTSNLYRQRTLLMQLKIDLNQLLARNAEEEFDVADSVPFEVKLKFDDLKNEAGTANSDLIYAQHNISLSNHVLRETRSQLFPTLNFNANYLFSRSENQAGFALLNQNLGLNLGLTARWTIFNGLNTNNQIKNGRLYRENAEYELKSTKQRIDHALTASYRNYLDDENILLLEQENVDRKSVV